MRRAEPEPERALPPPPSMVTMTEEGLGPIGGVWTTSERSPKLGYKPSPKQKMKRSNSWGSSGKMAQPEETQGAVGSLSSPEKPTNQSATKGRAIETWLNRSLDDAGKAKNDVEYSEGAISTQKKNQGLSNFGIDTASLEQLGLDPATSDRVHRAIFVYSQGIHSVLQDAVSTLKNRSQALLLLWKAFSAVLESAATQKGGGQDSLAALISQGNAEEIQRLEREYGEQIQTLKSQLETVREEKAVIRQDVLRLEEEEERQRNEKLMYRKDHEIAVQKHELEIRQRMAAEVRYLDKEHWAQSLQEDLNKERKQIQHLSEQNAETNKVKINLQIALDDALSQVRGYETQLMECRQQSLESAQQKQRVEHQINQLKQGLERSTEKSKELKEQVDAADESKIALQDTIAQQSQKIRKAEMALEDESHFKEELQNERDTLRKRLDVLDKETMELMDSRRSLQKQINDLRIQARTDEIEVKRLKEVLENDKRKYKKQEEAYHKIVEAHRKVEVECGFLKEDVRVLDENLKKEQELRKSLQLDKQTLQAQVQNVETEKMLANLAVANSKKEMMEITKKTVKIESVCQQTQQAMQKIQVEASVERKAQVKKIAMLEKVISDERQQRREIVKETEELDEKRQETLRTLEKKEVEVKELKRIRLEKEEEADRAKILLKDEQRKAEALLTLKDQQHSVVANHNAEVRQMQVILEDERAQAQAQISALKASYEVARTKLEQEIDSWQLRFEDALSLLHFNPMVEKIARLEKESETSKVDMEKKEKNLKIAESENAQLSADVEEKAAHINTIETAHDALQIQHRKLEDDFEKCVLHGERTSHQLADTEVRLLQIIDYVAAFDTEKAVMENKIAEDAHQIKQLEARLYVPKKDGGCQAKPIYACTDIQTDLSYQYLEDNDVLQNGAGRKARLNNLKVAADFVQDGHAKRDFSVNMKTGAECIHEITFEPGAYCRTELGERGKTQHVALKVAQLRAPGELPQLVGSPKKTPRVLQPQPPPYVSPKQQSKQRGDSSLTPSPWTDEGRRGPL